MKTTFLLFFLVIASVSHAAERLVLEVYRLVPAPPESTKDVRLILKATNNSDRPLYYFSLSQTMIDTTTERRKIDRWEVEPRFICGNAVTEYSLQVILPRTYVVFDESGMFEPPRADDKDFDPAKYEPRLTKLPVRFRLTLFEDEARKKPVEAVSRTFMPAEFVRK